MKKIVEKILSSVQFCAAVLLILFALFMMAWSVFEIYASLSFTEDFIAIILKSVSAIVIAAAILDVAAYLIEEEVFKSKELRDPVEARKTITKIIVIITIAVSFEGLVYIFKAGTEDMKLLVYPAGIILSAAVLIIALGVYQKLSSSIEAKEIDEKR